MRQAALIAGFAMLIMGLPARFAEFFVYPKLVIPANIEEAVQIIVANQGLFLVGMFSCLTAFMGDVVVAWALYVLLVDPNGTWASRFLGFILDCGASWCTGLAISPGYWGFCWQSLDWAI